MLRMTLLVGTTLALLVACGNEVTYLGDGDGGSGGDPCLGADCPAPGCPGTSPIQGTSCDLPDMTECRYADPIMGDCSSVWQCSPVYPEAGAPSEWYFMGQEGICECVSETCDPGDVEVSDCIPDAGCYTLDNFCNDGVIVCADIALPQHGCPLSQPTDGMSCSDQGMFCDYPQGNDCFSSVMCDSGSWWWIGGGCDGGGGSGASSSSGTAGFGGSSSSGSGGFGGA